jgi:hypothetical protein
MIQNAGMTMRFRLDRSLIAFSAVKEGHKQHESMQMEDSFAEASLRNHNSIIAIPAQAQRADRTEWAQELTDGGLGCEALVELQVGRVVPRRRRH